MVGELERKGLGVLLTECLAVRENDELLVIYDESSEEYAKELANLAYDLGPSLSLLLVPQEQQRRIVDSCAPDGDPVLSRGLVQALLDADAIINIVAGELDMKPFRGAVIESSRRADARFAHIPGLSYDVLKCLAETDIAGTQTLVQDMALVFGECDHLLLKTGDHNRLEIRLRGWVSEPLQSPGVIHQGSWGNVPPGETFVCPEVGDVSGSLRIDGSIPGFLLGPSEHIDLDISDSRVVRWEASSDRLTSFLKHREQDADRKGDENWNVVCEVGVGMNRQLHELTGNPLFDEKVFGTVHVALGDNSVFGCGVKSGWHADMVCRHPHLLANGVSVVKDGEVRIDRSQWQISAEKLSKLPGCGKEGVQIWKGRVSQDKGKLYRRLSKAGRVSVVQMGNDHVSLALAELYAAWKESLPADIGSVERMHSEFQGFQTSDLIKGLAHFGVLA